MKSISETIDNTAISKKILIKINGVLRLLERIGGRKAQKIEMELEHKDVIAKKNPFM